MKRLWLLAALVASPAAQAYTPDELRGDCQAAEEMYAQKKSSDPFKSIRSARCIAYVAGFADGYSVSNYLAEQVSVKLNAFCLPNDPDLSMRLVRDWDIINDEWVTRLDILPGYAVLYEDWAVKALSRPQVTT